MQVPAPPPAPPPAWKPEIALGDGWSLVPDAQYRPRLFIDSGANFTATPGALGNVFTERVLINHRARLGATVKKADFFSMHIQLQDVRVWGEETDVTNDISANGFDMHQGYVAFNMGKHLEAKIGRQEIIFDNHRLVGNLGWYQRARSFDAARLNIKVPDVLNASAFWSMAAEQTIVPDGTQNNPTAPRTSEIGFGGIHLNIAALKNPGISLTYLVHENVPAKETRHTVGGQASGKVAGLSYQVEGFYQLGQTQFTNAMAEAIKEPIGAFMAAAKLGYDIDVATKPNITAAIDYLSGTDATNPNRRTGVFDTLYATNHAFYGEMDIFLNLPVHTAGLGLMDIWGKVGFNPHKDLNISLMVHYFMTAKPTAAMGAGAGATNLGLEFDLKAVYKMNKYLSLDLFYGTFLPGDGMKGIKTIPNGNLSPEHQVYMTIDAAI